jgi:hypothetical protein
VTRPWAKVARPEFLGVGLMKRSDGAVAAAAAAAAAAAEKAAAAEANAAEAKPKAVQSRWARGPSV